MSLEQRLELHANHKVYDAEYTINCIKDCIILNEGYPMYEATYGEVCKNKENRLAMSSYLGDVGHCMYEMAFGYFELKIESMCDFINQETKVLDYPADDS
ncbi:hypothetical protein M438DRAFT_337171 [Aureobasidium pullulans EXF-150]|uniref:Uncharacterized protein n=1 Tax=Aureobasidium pullulans EXF-150 TaxID=1043002 RepID=A0A074XEK9_AURPU|nr:uncharacterized protein M438DRAFT_337171 [Aureobasidium pullulans EXF-150]KEQ82119.1 hypothetical protein M438DRAFT_337171 [Aureobasidium pullulans EXF-150]